MMDQRVAIVTGGARGIGAAISSSLARSGVHVAASYAGYITGSVISVNGGMDM